MVGQGPLVEGVVEGGVCFGLREVGQVAISGYYLEVFPQLLVSDMMGNVRHKHCGFRVRAPSLCACVGVSEWWAEEVGVELGLGYQYIGIIASTSV